MSADLQDIIKGCVKRDYKYQKLLYTKYASLLYAICLRYLKNTDDAKDAVQDCFMKVYDKIAGFNHEGSFDGWIKRLTVNNCLIVLREKKKAVFVDEIYLWIKLNFFGRSDVKDNFSLVNGCVKSNWEACKYNPLPFKTNGSIP